MSMLRNGSKGDLNPDSLDCESSILPLSYRGRIQVLDRHLLAYKPMGTPPYTPTISSHTNYMYCNRPGKPTDSLKNNSDTQNFRKPVFL